MEDKSKPIVCGEESIKKEEFHVKIEEKNPTELELKTKSVEKSKKKEKHKEEDGEKSKKKEKEKKDKEPKEKMKEKKKNKDEDEEQKQKEKEKDGDEKKKKKEKECEVNTDEAGENVKEEKTKEKKDKKDKKKEEKKKEKNDGDSRDKEEGREGGKEDKKKKDKKDKKKHKDEDLKEEEETGKGKDKKSSVKEEDKHTGKVVDEKHEEKLEKEKKHEDGEPNEKGEMKKKGKEKKVEDKEHKEEKKVGQTVSGIERDFSSIPLGSEMNCLQILPRSSALPLQSFKCCQRSNSCSVSTLGVTSSAGPQRSMAVKAISGSTSSAEASSANVKEEKSETYSNNMTEAMGAVLTYRHELGMNYDFIRPDLIVGSCLQTPEDVDKLRSIGVKTIFCLQQDPDLEYFGVDINAIREYAKTYDDIQHLRAEIRDFDAFDLRIRLPAVVSQLYKAINRNGGVTYIHCTAGMGRAPGVALAYMFWVQGYQLSEANKLLLSKRSCFPKLDAIKSASADILTGLRKKLVTLTWKDNNCSAVEISGLDIGWGQRIPLKFDEERGLWILNREMQEGHYEYKYVVDGEWMHNNYELLTSVNKDGHVNNYVQVLDDDPDSLRAILWRRLTGDEPNLTMDERLKIRQFLEAFPDDEQ